VGEALHPEREPLAVLQSLREQLGEYNFAGQYQQSPAPLGGGMIKAEWFKTCPSADWPALKDFTLVYQSWDTANKSTELSDYSVCTTWGRDKHNKLYVLDVFRQRLDYPALKRAVRFMAEQFNAKTILIEDKASGTQLIQELISEGVHGITGYETKLDKVMRMHSVSSTIENGFVYLPEKADWLATFRHELTVFPNGKHDDQVDSTSQALDWIRKGRTGIDALTEYYRRSAEEAERHPRSHNLW
jgi:predicted phage terminase large subunit-like protein